VKILEGSGKENIITHSISAKEMNEKQTLSQI
jgi:hypothetical protein